MIMRGLSVKTKMILERAGLWDNPCLMCGAHGTTEAEHAHYKTRDRRQGMGAKQLDDFWSILPCCRECNHSRQNQKLMRWAMACAIGIDLGLLKDSDILESYLPFSHDFTVEQNARREIWVEKLRSCNAA